MSNVAKHCGCRSCRQGLHRRRSRGKATTRRACRKFRHQSKQALAKGQEPPRVFTVPYTD